jgi:vacuolar-type H+-ATPase subunit F/Vma7
MTDLTLPGFDTIKIVDDSKASAQKSKFLAEEFTNIEVQLITDGKHDSVNKLLDRVLRDVVNTKRTGVLCDNRLFMNGGFANFYGAEFVAELYKHDVAAILLTEYAGDDIDLSIREYRRRIPVMMRRDDLNETTLVDGFNFCKLELGGSTPASRIPYRTIVQIKEWVREGDKDLAVAIVPGWDASQEVRFPFALMEHEIIVRMKAALDARRDFYVFAQVNIGARQSSELFFDRFEIAREPKLSPLDINI